MEACFEWDLETFSTKENIRIFLIQNGFKEV